MDEVRVFARPLPPGMVTLRAWAGEVGRDWRSIHSNWKPREGFPARAGVTAAGAGNNGGGLPEDVFERQQLNDWRAGEPDLWGRRSVRLITGHGEDARVSLPLFARLAGTAVPSAAAPGFPLPLEGDFYRLGDLIGWQNAQPPSAGPLLAATALGRETLVSLAAFARLVGKAGKTVTQYRHHPRFPQPADGRSYLLGEVADFWNRRPGKGGRTTAGNMLPTALQQVPLSGPARKVLVFAARSGLGLALVPAGEGGGTAISLTGDDGLRGTITVSPSGRILHAELQASPGDGRHRYRGTGQVGGAIASWAGFPATWPPDLSAARLLPGDARPGAGVSTGGGRGATGGPGRGAGLLALPLALQERGGGGQGGGAVHRGRSRGARHYDEHAAGAVVAGGQLVGDRLHVQLLHGPGPDAQEPREAAGVVHGDRRFPGAAAELAQDRGCQHLDLGVREPHVLQGDAYGLGNCGPHCLKCPAGLPGARDLPRAAGPSPPRRASRRQRRPRRRRGPAGCAAALQGHG